MRWSIPDIALATILPGLVILHLYISPYTKVEESFNLQATHDILKYGVPSRNSGEILRKYYDHVTFTGSVPRTFVGPLVLSGLSTPIIWLFPEADRQLIVRGILGLSNAFSLLVLRNSLSKAFGNGVGRWYLLLQASQFHIIYYASRTLPNMFAFGLTTLATAALLPSARHSPAKLQRRQRLALYLLTFAGVVFRSEITLYLASLVLYHVLASSMDIPKVVIPAGLAGALVGLLVSVPIDTFFWQSPRPLWSELEGFIFNILHNKASEWGVSPWHYYFTSALPRLLINPLSFPLLLPLPALLIPTRKAALSLIVPSLVFVAVYSFQPHKEWRFIIYVVPALTGAAALGANWIWTRRTKSFVYQILSLLLIASTLASFLASTAMGVVSSFNYPGGNALQRLHGLADGSQRVVSVHTDVLSCMTGVSRFQEKSADSLSHWIYDKTEEPDTLLRAEFWDKFDYVIAERPEKVIGSWEIVDTVNGFAGFQIVNEQKKKDTSVEGGKWWEHYANEVEDWIRHKVTRGRWITIKIKPQLRVLRKQKLDAEPS